MLKNGRGWLLGSLLIQVAFLSPTSFTGYVWDDAFNWTLKWIAALNGQDFLSAVAADIEKVLTTSKEFSLRTFVIGGRYLWELACVTPK